MDESGWDRHKGQPEDLAWDVRLRKAAEAAAESGQKFPLRVRVAGAWVTLGEATLEKRGDDIYVTSVVDHPIVEEVLGSAPEVSIQPPLKFSDFQRIYNPRELSEEERIKKWRNK